MNSVPHDARKQREAPVIQFRPQICFWDPYPERFEAFQTVFQEMNWWTNVCTSTESFIQSHLIQGYHFVLTSVQDRAAFEMVYENLKHTGRLPCLTFGCMNGTRDIYEYLKEKQVQKMFFNSHSHSLAHIVQTLRQFRPDLVRIAIADDLYMIRSQLKMAILLLKFSLVAEASNGIEAVNSCMELKPDLLTLDIQMPLKNGLQTLLEVRQTSPHTRIVMISGQGTESNVIESARQGIRHFISKPFPRDLLMNTLREACNDTDYLASIRF